MWPKCMPHNPHGHLPRAHRESALVVGVGVHSCLNFCFLKDSWEISTCSNFILGVLRWQLCRSKEAHLWLLMFKPSALGPLVAQGWPDPLVGGTAGAGCSPWSWTGGFFCPPPQETSPLSASPEFQPRRETRGEGKGERGQAVLGEALWEEILLRTRRL